MCPIVLCQFGKLAGEVCGVCGVDAMEAGMCNSGYGQAVDRRKARYNRGQAADRMAKDEVLAL